MNFRCQTGSASEIYDTVEQCSIYTKLTGDLQLTLLYFLSEFGEDWNYGI